MKMKAIEPWVGKCYSNPKILPKRTIIIGSNYINDPDQFTQDIVIRCINADISGGDLSGFSEFSNSLRTLILGQRNIGRSEFWADIAFYNFIQYPVGSAGKQRPAPPMWRDSAPYFCNLVDQLNPEQILILGVDNWRNIVQFFRQQVVSDYETKIQVRDKEILAGYVLHPSPSLNHSEWTPVAQGLLGII